MHTKNQLITVPGLELLHSLLQLCTAKQNLFRKNMLQQDAPLLELKGELFSFLELSLTACGEQRLGT